MHIAEPHGFNIGGARQPGGCVNSQHSHLTAEVFVVHSGRWRMLFGQDGRDGHVDVEPGDVVSLPVRMFRGFEKRDEGKGFLWVVLGGDDPGKVAWAPDVFARAEATGLRLLKGGRLIETGRGESIPPGAELEEPPSPEQLAEWATPPMAEMEKAVCRGGDMEGNPQSRLAGEGVEECGIVNLSDTSDGFPAGPIRGGWQHGFALRQLRIAAGACIPLHTRFEGRGGVRARGRAEHLLDRKAKSRCGPATPCRFRWGWREDSRTEGPGASSLMSCAAATTRPRPNSAIRTRRDKVEAKSGTCMI